MSLCQVDSVETYQENIALQMTTCSRPDLEHRLRSMQGAAYKPQRDPILFELQPLQSGPRVCNHSIVVDEALAKQDRTLNQ